MKKLARTNYVGQHSNYTQYITTIASFYLIILKMFSYIPKKNIYSQWFTDNNSVFSSTISKNLIFISN